MTSEHMKGFRNALILSTGIVLGACGPKVDEGTVFYKDIEAAEEGSSFSPGGAAVGYGIGGTQGALIGGMVAAESSQPEKYYVGLFRNCKNGVVPPITETRQITKKCEYTVWEVTKAEYQNAIPGNPLTLRFSDS